MASHPTETNKTFPHDGLKFGIIHTSVDDRPMVIFHVFDEDGEIVTMTDGAQQTKVVLPVGGRIAYLRNILVVTRGAGYGRRVIGALLHYLRLKSREGYPHKYIQAACPAVQGALSPTCTFYTSIDLKPGASNNLGIHMNSDIDAFTQTRRKLKVDYDAGRLRYEPRARNLPVKPLERYSF